MEYAVEMRHITKRFRTVVANDNVSLAVRPGTVHAVIGENGAGKTTLMNILYGLYQPDGGQIFIDGQERRLASATDAIKCGIGMVHQHFTLIPRLSVADNIVLGSEPHRGLCYDRKAAKEQVEQVCREYGIAVDPGQPVSRISLGMQQRVEIVKTLYRGANIIILDEPTAVLTPQEIDELGRTLSLLKAKGKTILIITHKLEEVMEFSDTITVLRNGQHVVTVPKVETDVRSLTAYMVGRQVHLGGQKVEKHFQGDLLELRHISCCREGREVLQDISLTVHQGEILGIAGVDGSGQTELTEVIAGVLPSSSGTLVYCGEEINRRTIAERKRQGIAFIPQDRHKHGLVLGFSVEENLLLGAQRDPELMSRKFFQNRKAIHTMAEERIAAFGIRPADSAARVNQLSGGNQQKVVIAREVGTEPKLIVADQPTRGVDIGAIEAIHDTLVRHRNNGGAVVLASLELDEVMMLSDRIAVMCAGKLMGILPAAEATREEIGLMMVGSNRTTEVDS